MDRQAYLQYFFNKKDSKKPLSSLHYQPFSDSGNKQNRVKIRKTKKSVHLKKQNNLQRLSDSYQFRITNKLLLQKIMRPKRDKLIKQSLQSCSSIKRMGSSHSFTRIGKMVGSSLQSSHQGQRNRRMFRNYQKNISIFNDCSTPESTSSKKLIYSTVTKCMNGRNISGKASHEKSFNLSLENNRMGKRILNTKSSVEQNLKMNFFTYNGNNLKRKPQYDDSNDGIHPQKSFIKGKQNKRYYFSGKCNNGVKVFFNNLKQEGKQRKTEDINSLNQSLENHIVRKNRYNHYNHYNRCYASNTQYHPNANANVPITFKHPNKMFVKKLTSLGRHIRTSDAQQRPSKWAKCSPWEEGSSQEEEQDEGKQGWQKGNDEDKDDLRQGEGYYEDFEDIEDFREGEGEGEGERERVVEKEQEGERQGEQERGQEEEIGLFDYNSSNVSKCQNTVIVNNDDEDKNIETNFPQYFKLFGKGPTILKIYNLEIDCNPKLKDDDIIMFELIHSQYHIKTAKIHQKPIRTTPIVYRYFKNYSNRNHHNNHNLQSYDTQPAPTSCLKFAINVSSIGDFVPLKIYRIRGVQIHQMGIVDINLFGFKYRKRKITEQREQIDNQKENENVYVDVDDNNENIKKQYKINNDGICLQREVFHGHTEEFLRKKNLNKMVDIKIKMDFKVYPKKFK